MLLHDHPELIPIVSAVAVAAIYRLSPSGRAAAAVRRSARAEADDLPASATPQPETSPR